MKMLRLPFLLLLLLSVGTTLGNQNPVRASTSVAHHNQIDSELVSDISDLERAEAQQNIADWMEETIANVVGTPTTSEAARQSQAAWTVLVYLAADNDLEAFAIDDINEMELVGSTTDINIVVQMDRAADYDTSNGNWTDTRRFFIMRDDNFSSIASQPVQTIGETNSGDPDTLADFAVWGIQTYPAQRYALIIWDHGAAWLGIASDDSADGDDLSMPELDRALSQITSTTGVAQLDVIGFDACLMGQFEVYQTVAPYARYGVGAEELIPGNGWDYVNSINALARNPALDGEAFGRALVDTYMNFYTEIVTYYDVFDLGVADLSQTANVGNALDSFASAVMSNPGPVLSAIGDARNNTIAFGGFDDPQFFDIWSATDLIHFMDLMADLSPDSAVAQAAQNLAAAGSQMMVYHQANERLAEARGVTIYFPRNQEAYGQYNFSSRYAQSVPDSMANWISFLETFYNTAIETVTEGAQVDILGVYPELASIHQPAVVQMEITGRDIVKVVFTATLEFDDGTAVIVEYTPLVSSAVTASGAEITNWADGVSTRSFSWGAEIPVISDGNMEVPTLLFVDQEDPSSAVVYGTFVPQSGAQVDAHLIYDLNTGLVTSVWGIRETTSGFAPFELSVKPGDTFHPEWLFFDTDGELVSTPATDALTFGENPFTYRLDSAPTGTYTLSVRVEDIAGNQIEDATTIQVNNDGLDTSQRGFTDIEFGVNFRYPATWIEPRFLETDEGGRLFTGDPATGTVLTVLPYGNVSEALDVAQAVIDSWNTLENAELVNQQQVEVSGYDAYVVDYTYTFQGTDRAGAVLAIYVPEQGIGYGFDLDAPAAALDIATSAFSLLVESVNFFDVAGLLGTSNWATMNAGNGLISFSVPTAWNQQETGDWTVYHVAGNESIFMAINVSPSQGLTNEQLADQYFGLLQQNTNISNVQVLASEPYFIGDESWHAVVFSLTYNDGTPGDGAYFVTSIGAQEYVFWIEAPEAVFDQTFEDVFSVIINSFTFNG